MSVTTNIQIDWTTDGAPPIPATKTLVTHDARRMTITIAADQTKLGYEFISLAAGRKGLLIITDEDVTVGINDGVTPEQSKDLTPTAPGFWYDGMPGTAFWTGDIDGLYFTTGPNGAVVQIRLLEDNVAI